MFSKLRVFALFLMTDSVSSNSDAELNAIREPVASHCAAARLSGGSVLAAVGRRSSGGSV